MDVRNPDQDQSPEPHRTSFCVLILPSFSMGPFENQSERTISAPAEFETEWKFKELRLKNLTHEGGSAFDPKLVETSILKSLCKASRIIEDLLYLFLFSYSIKLPGSCLSSTRSKTEAEWRHGNVQSFRSATRRVSERSPRWSKP